MCLPFNQINESKWPLEKVLYLHKHTAANSLMALSGGLHSGKNGLAAYSANVIATIAWVVGL